MKMKSFLTLLLALVVQITFAQEKTVTGTVSDESGPLPGVNVIIKGTQKGTQTDFDGKYTLKAKKGDVLLFSYVGMTSVEKKVGTSNTIDIVMKQDSNVLSDVVVVAYGTQTKQSIVGAVAVVDDKVIEKQQATSVTAAIQGSVPGVNVISSGGQPGENPTIRIRGISSINADASPLIILDGVPYNGNLNSISSDQVESMNVLKDASSTALYGSRGANGVILIVTKKGKLNSKPKFSFKSTVGFASQAVDPHEIVGVDKQFLYTWEAIRNKIQYVDGDTAASAGQKASEGLVSAFGYNPYGPTVLNPVDANGNLVTTNKLWDTNWRDYLINDNAVRKEHGLNVSGGSAKTTYFFSANYLDQEGSVAESDFERITTRVNLNSKVNDWLELGFNTSYATSKQNYPDQAGSSYASTIQWTTSVAPVYPVYRRDENGQLIYDSFGNKIFDYGNNNQTVNGTRPVFDNENAYGSLFNYQRKRNRNNIQSNGHIQINFSEDLNFKSSLGYEKYIYDSYDYVHNEYGYASNVGGRVSQNRNFVTTTNLINSLNYQKSFGDHNVNVNLIQEAYKAKFDYLGAQGTGFLPNIYVLNGSTTPEGVSGYTAEDRIASYLGRATYNFRETYFVEGSFRRDGSTRFSKDSRWGNFYSVGGSWIVSNENFLADNTILSYLKLKASYGELGNNRTSSFFPYTTNFETGWNELDNTGVILGSVSDSNLTWEKTSSFNAGIDFNLFNDKIDGTVEYYEKKSIDLIYSKPLPPSTGNSSITTNVGSLKNSGIEVSLNSKNFNTGDFEWSTGFNITFENNEITELTQDSYISGTKRWEVGTSLYEFYLRKYEGVDPTTGDALWLKDVKDADGNITGTETTNDYSEATRYALGKESLPDFTGGFSNYVRYKNFDMNILFNFSYGAYVYDYTYAALMSSMGSIGRAASPDLDNRWKQPGDIANVPKLLNSNNNYNSTSDRFLFKNDYIRLKALNFGYNLPEEMIKNYGMSKFRLYFQGDNLFTYQSHKGIDPEQNLSGTTNNRSYNQKIVSFGINVEF